MKNIKTFETFVNEEISDEFIDKNVKLSKDAGRSVSEPYTDMLKKRNTEHKTDRTLLGMKSIVGLLNITFSETVDSKIVDKTTFSILFKSQNYQLNYYGYADNFVFYVEGNEKQLSYGIQAVGNLSSDDKRVTFLNYLSSLFKKYIPESKYADRRIWSSSI